MSMCTAITAATSMPTAKPAITTTTTTATIPTTSPPSCSRASALLIRNVSTSSWAAWCRSSARRCCATRACCRCWGPTARSCSKGCIKSWAATWAQSGARPKPVAVKWCLLVKIYQKTYLSADWNNVWYKLHQFCGRNRTRLTACRNSWQAWQSRYPRHRRHAHNPGIVPPLHGGVGTGSEGRRSPSGQRLSRTHPLLRC
ncbi:hypothetical protein MASSI9I_51297 [Massilia sp. 9I]|nr:hypothetical protein MASSI9I_51297 [Massilia sp. 9I]